MTRRPRGVVAVVGATGMQGRAVTRLLSRQGWHVRALTRKPDAAAARALAAVGAEVCRADTTDPASLQGPFHSADAVFTVQNHHISGYAGEVVQGRNVTDVALRLDVPHIVYSAAGPGSGGTGVGSWETKVEVIRHMRDRNAPVTVLRPMAFMELMSLSRFFPAASTWHVMPRLMGETRPVAWLAVDDLAAIVAKVLEDPKRFVGADLPLAADVRSIAECRQLWRAAMGRRPGRAPMPLWLFERFVGTDETTMWRWLGSHEIDLDTAAALGIHPEALTVEAWLARLRPGSRGEPPVRRRHGRRDTPV